MAYPKFQPSEWLTTYRANLSSADTSGHAFADEQEAAERAHAVIVNAMDETKRAAAQRNADHGFVTRENYAAGIVRALKQEGLLK